MTEFFIRDRKTFQDFLGLTPYQTIPDAKTIWLSAEQVKNAQLEEVLFDKFLETLESKRIHPQGGTLVDGTFVEVPCQHNTKAENEQLKKGEIPQEFKLDPHRLAQKDCDGNWAKKGGVAFFGYKDHPWVDAVWKLMWDYNGHTRRSSRQFSLLECDPGETASGLRKIVWRFGLQRQ